MNRAAPLLCFALLAQPAVADRPDAASLLAQPGTALTGALAACATGATDPTAADALFTAAGWTKEPDDEMGVVYYSTDGLSVMMWPDPGFCMVDAAVSTDAMAAALTGLTPVTEGTDADGCRIFAFDTVIASLSGPGQDPVCEADDSATLRFAPTQ